MSVPARIRYVGKHQRSLDAKNRLTIPSKWRFEGDTDDVYLALPDPSGCIVVMPPAQVDKLYEDVESRKLSDEDAQGLLDKLMSQAASFGCDKQGRIHIPEELLRHAGIEREAIVVGRLVNFRIWSPDRWKTIDPQSNRDDIGHLMKLVNL